jgi:biopolymer transport protein ExbB/TolQ
MRYGSVQEYLLGRAMLMITPTLGAAGMSAAVVRAFADAGLLLQALIVLLLLGSVGCWYLMLLKAWEFHWARAAARRFAAAYRRENHPLAVFIQGRAHAGPLAAIYRQACQAVLAHTGPRAPAPELFVSADTIAERMPLRALEVYAAGKAARQAAVEASALLEQHLGWLGAGAALIPTAGLLGAVWRLLDVLTADAAGPAASAAALLALLTALLVALPVLIGYNVLLSQWRGLDRRLHEFAGELADDLERASAQQE